MRCRIYVSVFALVVYRHDPNGIPIVAARFPGSTAWKKKSILDFIGYFIGFYDIVIVLKRVIFGHTRVLEAQSYST